MQEDSIVGDIGKIFHLINASLEDWQEDHQTSIVENQGTISNQNLSILIEPGATVSYINPKMMENCHLTKVRHARTWSVQVATQAKRKVTLFVANCEISIQDEFECVSSSVLSYDY